MESKRNNYKYTFLLELESVQEEDQLTTMLAEMQQHNLKAKIQKAMTLKQGATFWLHISLDPTGAPLSRKYFSATHHGAKLLKERNITLIREVPAAAVERQLETLATDEAVEPLGDEALSFVQERKAVHQMKA